MMDSSLLWPAAAALAGAALATLVCRWRARSAMAALVGKLQRSEQARQADHVRALQTRQQVNKLTQMVADLQKRQRVAMEQQQVRAQLDVLVPSPPVGDAPQRPAHGFADTLPL